MPMVGLGLWKAPGDVTAQVVYDAVKLGYRHLDCACDYGNEPAVGEALKRLFAEGVCTRADLWITSKLWNTYHAAEHVPLACQHTLDDLGLDYLDLYLIHFPIALQFVPFEKRYPPEWCAPRRAPRSARLPSPDQQTALPLRPCRTDEGNAGVMRFADVPYRETWEAMEGLHAAGKARHIGVSNLNVQSLLDVLRYAKVKPACNQVENHLHLQQPKLATFCRDVGIAVVGFSPLGAASYIGMGLAQPAEDALQEPAVLRIAAAKGKSAAQVLLRYQLQRGICVVPKSQDKGRLKQNLDLGGFELGADEVAALGALDRNRRFNDPAVYAKGWGEPGSWLAEHGYPLYE